MGTQRDIWVLSVARRGYYTTRPRRANRKPTPIRWCCETFLAWSAPGKPLSYSSFWCLPAQVRGGSYSLRFTAITHEVKWHGVAHAFRESVFSIWVEWPAPVLKT